MYLRTDVEDVEDVLLWWYEHRSMYPQLSHMAMDYLTIPGKSIIGSVVCSVCLLLLRSATSVDVERTFSCGRLLLSHVRSHLSAQTTRAILCLGIWSSMGLVKDNDIKAVATLPDVDGDDKVLDDGWDDINL